MIRVAPDGTQAPVLEDADPDHLAWVEAAFVAGTMGRPHLDKARRARACATSPASPSAAPTLRTAYLGCLLGDATCRAFASPVAGHPPDALELAADP